MGDELEMNAAIVAMNYIKKHHTDKKKPYSVIAISSGNAGPERIMMNLLKNKKYQLATVWLVDVYCPEENILKEIKSYATTVHCVSLPKMKEILLTNKPSTFDHTYCFAVHYQMFTFELLKDTSENVQMSKTLLTLHQDPWTWIDELNLPVSFRNELLKNPKEYEKQIQDYYKTWLDQFGIKKGDPHYNDMLGEIKDLSPLTLQKNANSLLNKYIKKEFGHFIWIWMDWYQKSFATIWRDGKICEISIDDFKKESNEYIVKNYFEFYNHFHHLLQTKCRDTEDPQTHKTNKQKKVN